MPARRQLEPAEITALLPHFMLIDRVDDRFRYRLVGTAVTKELGQEITGIRVGSSATPPGHGAALRSLYERIFATGRALFTTGEYRSPSQAIHAVSRVMLPLGDDGATVNMVMVTRIALFSRNVSAGVDWLKGASGKVCEIVEIGSLAEIEALSLAWERQCLPAEPAA